MAESGNTFRGVQKNILRIYYKYALISGKEMKNDIVFTTYNSKKSYCPIF